jgi:hypothetical protein
MCGLDAGDHLRCWSPNRGNVCYPIRPKDGRVLDFTESCVISSHQALLCAGRRSSIDMEDP